MSDDYLFNQAGEPMSLEAWRVAFSDHELRLIALDEIGDARVSTVWLGVNHNFWSGPPLIFESMIFGGPLDDTCVRYATREQALAGHRDLVAALANRQT